MTPVGSEAGRSTQTSKAPSSATRATGAPWHPASLVQSDGYRPAIAVPVVAPRALPPSAVAQPGRQRRIWPDHHVQWGVPREPWRFDIEDPAAHRGRTQHAYPLGHDHRAVCGFETPLVRAFVGPKRPLLALAGPDNPRCRSCAAVIVPAPPMVPHVTPYASERRPDGRTWLDDRLGALGIPPVSQAGRPRTRPPIDPPWPTVDQPLPRLGPGPLTAASTAVLDDLAPAEASQDGAGELEDAGPAEGTPEASMTPPKRIAIPIEPAETAPQSAILLGP